MTNPQINHLDSGIINEIFAKKTKKKDEREGWGGPVEFFLATLGYTSNLL